MHRSNKPSRRALGTSLSALFALSTLVGGASAQALEGGARAAALGGAATALSNSEWSDGNVATPATRQRAAVAFFASQSYGLSELRLAQVQYTQPTSIGAIAVSLMSFGFTDYRTTQASLGFAREFSLGSTRYFALGARVQYTGVSIPSYGSTGAVGISFAGLASITDELSFGFQATNLNAPELTRGEELERALAAGFQYVPDDRVVLLLDIYKDVRFPASARGGIEVRAAEPLFLRAGFGSSPSRFTGGVGVLVSVLTIDIALQRHDVLGWSPAASMGVEW